MEKSSSSKVTVEYHDPSGVFSLLQGELEGRLPLRNLHWKSPARPLRNIDALHVDFVSDATTSNDSSATPEPAGDVGELRRSTSVRAARKPSADLWGGPRSKGHRSTSQPVGVPKVRRHQIPGLRETPYLKLFILRCDDKAAYKTEHRQQLKDWVRSISPSPTQSTPNLNKHNNHDAFEWMIIHVVIPDTQAASEPRWTAAKNDPDELAERSKGKTKWTGKGTTTVFDKVRADFLPSSKHASERVAQIRLPKNVVPAPFLPKIPVPTQLFESSQEQDNAWQDLVAKFKTLILQSFDLRVGQYEDDIRAKEAQRALPGWNFCTFFTLKENLARGFESVGLVEDALSIYDELAAGLDATTSCNNAFLGDMAAVRNELMDLSNKEGEQIADSSSQSFALLDKPLDVSHKDYRTLIVSSTISLFDFHTYIFARQRLLIYRLGSFEPQDATNPTPSSADKSRGIKSEEQLLHVAEVCRRASAFISSNTRTLRKELEAAPDTVECTRYDAIIQSVAASWAYATSEQILAETSVSSVYALSESTEPQPVSVSYLSQPGAAFPRRSSSLSYENSQAGASDGSQMRTATAGSGLAELAASRGELCLLQRRFLEALALKRGWHAGWAAFDPTQTFGINDSSDEEALRQYRDNMKFLNSEILDALKSVTTFREAYENVTDLAIRHLSLGSRVAMVETLMGDLALLKYQAGDYTAAAQIFQKLVAKYTSNDWTAVEEQMLQIYTKCLKILNRKDEYVRVSLGLLQKNTSKGSAEPPVIATGLRKSLSLQELVEYSKDASNPYKALFEDLFTDLHIDSEIKQSDDQDGFSIDLSFLCRIDELFVIDSIRLKLVSSTAAVPEITLATDKPIHVSTGPIHVRLDTAITTMGLFSIQQIVVELSELHFIHNYEPKQKPTPFGFAERPTIKNMPEPAGPLVMVYPRSGALDVRIRSCPEVAIDKRKSVYVDVRTGNLPFDEISVKLRPATAGLRLQTADAKLLEAGDTKLRIDNSNALNLRDDPDTSVTIIVPYGLEISQAELLIRAEVICSRDGQIWTFFFEEEVPTDLLLDVNVNDLFKPDALFSRFTLRTTDGDPLIIHSIDIQDSDAYAVKAPPCPPDTIVFDKQPVSLACRITKKSSADLVDSKENTKALSLTVQYSSVSAMITESLASQLDDNLNTNRFRGLLIYMFRRLLAAHLTTKSLENAILLQSFQVPTYAVLGWDTFLSALPVASQSDVRAQLEGFHETSSSISLDLVSISADFSHRTLTIPVDVPTITLLVTARIQLDAPSPSPRFPPVAIVGRPLSCMLSITYTTNWAAAQPSSPQSLTFKISDGSESWLLAGASTATFTADSNVPVSFPLLLIPLVPGILHLPNVEVQVARLVEERADDAPLATPVSAAPRPRSVRTVLDTALLSPRAGGMRSARSTSGPTTPIEEVYACETNYESAGITVLVIRPPEDAEVSVVEGMSTASIGGLVMGADIVKA